MDLHTRSAVDPELAAALRGNESTYRRLLDRFAGVAAEAGAHVVPYGDGRLRLHDLGLDAQRQVIIALERYVEVAEHTSVKEKLTDQHFLWQMLVRMKLRPSSDLLGRIEADDIVEIYDANSLAQVFRNLRFFGVCSYTFDDLLARPWYELYRRDASITKLMGETVAKLLKKSTPDILHFDLEPHLLEEIDSIKMLRWLVRTRFIAKLHNENRQISAFVSVARPVSNMTVM